MRLRLRHRIVAGAMLGALAGVGVSATQTVARADDLVGDPTTAPAATLGGYQGRAASSGIYAYYTPEGALPVGPLAEFGAPDALATISSGPTTFARAAAADPGDILANPDAVFTLASPDYPQGTIPAWPYRVSATSGFGAPTAEASPAPGLNARVDATPEGSTARATMPRADGGAVATFGSMSSLATTKTDGASVTVHVRTEVTGFNLLDVLKAESIVTDLTATSDGGAPKLTGGTIVTGASVNGQAVTIDSSGIKGSGGGDALNDVLKAAGVHVTLAAPVEQGGDSAGQLAATGLRVDLDLSDKTVPALAALGALEQLPPLELAPGAPTLADIVVAARARHLSHVEVARGAVSITAGASSDTGLLDDLLEPLAPDGALSALGPALDASALAPLAVPAVARPATARAAEPVATAATVRAPNVPLGAGVGALVLLAVLVEPFVGARLARLAGTVIGGGGAAACPWEER